MYISLLPWCQCYKTFYYVSRLTDAMGKLVNICPCLIFLAQSNPCK